MSRAEEPRKQDNEANNLNKNNHKNEQKDIPMAGTPIGTQDVNMKQFMKEYPLFAKGKVVLSGHSGSLPSSDTSVPADSQTPVIGSPSDSPLLKAINYQVSQPSSTERSTVTNMQMQLQVALPTLEQETQYHNAQEDTRPSAQLDIKTILNVILDEIRGLRASQRVECAALHKRLSKTEEALMHIPQRLQEAESRISQLEDQVTSMQGEVSQTRKQKYLLEHKIEELENHWVHYNF
ncbi:hypothetical protein NDU88_005104 [Pleurodeles waltl]|uniref:Uncharacterized protein n=1 Tax=Pleurodeles waltl TaxID=8319 RepID=A0AAV7L1S5_PLEWA|nr:hypothetical protein NDU88_005104 [Pleurodeles waltl]